MIQRFFILGGLPLCFLLSALLAVAEPPSDADRKMIALEALTRLKGTDLNTNPALKAAALKVLAWTRGTPDFVTLVQDFNLTGQNPGLLEVAAENPADESGVEALRLIFASGDTSVIKNALTGTNLLTASKTAEALGNTHDKQIVPLLLPLVTDCGAMSLCASKPCARSRSAGRRGAIAPARPPGKTSRRRPLHRRHGIEHRPLAGIEGASRAIAPLAARPQHRSAAALAGASENAR